MADPVHADWKKRIEHSLIINLAIRRTAHDALGSFADYHLFRYDGEQMCHELDIFYKIEDAFYNRLVERQLRGSQVAQETVEYCRHPGNGYDRQYDKFCRPFAGSRDTATAKERFAIRLGEVIYGDLLAQRQKTQEDSNGREESEPALPREANQHPKATAPAGDGEALLQQGLRLAEEGRPADAVVLPNRRSMPSRNQRGRGTTWEWPWPSSAATRRPSPLWNKLFVCDPTMPMPVSTWATSCATWGGATRPSRAFVRPCNCVPIMPVPATTWGWL
jgi:hypothetical protein